MNTPSISCKLALQAAFALLIAAGNAQAQTSDPPGSDNAAPWPRNTLFLHDLDYAHLAVGGGWATQIVVVNMSVPQVAVPYTLRFYDDNGNAISLPFDDGSGSVKYQTVVNQTILPNGEQNFTFPNIGNLQVGHAVLSYQQASSDTGPGPMLGGYSIFQAYYGNQVQYEAAVPLSGSDSILYLAFWTFSGFESGIALANPNGSSTTIDLYAYDNLGNLLLHDRFALPPRGHTAFALASTYSQLRNRRGTLYITSSSGYLSAVGLRFTPTNSFTTIPIMNWLGMYQ
jgi:hypothetical protein